MHVCVHVHMWYIDTIHIYRYIYLTPFSSTFVFHFLLIFVKFYFKLNVCYYFKNI